MIIAHAFPTARVDDSPNNMNPTTWMLSHAQYIGSRLADFGAARVAIEQVAFTAPNWDGDGALPISREVKANALAALAILETTAVPAPEITPNPNGTLTFEWETDEGVGQLEIGKTRYSFYVRANSAPAILSGGNTDHHIDRVFGMLVDGLIYRKTEAENLVTDLTYSSPNV